jgi:hypothetical protein
MKIKKDKNFYLQHKLPWESEWEDKEIGKSVDCEKFNKILIDEPPYLIETEYRIIKKKITELRNNKKLVICPVCIESGFEVANRITKKKRDE